MPNDSILSIKTISDNDSESDDEIDRTFSSDGRCFIVYGSQLAMLLKRCAKCGAVINPTMIRESFANGSQLYFNIVCNNGCIYSWKSQPDYPRVKGQGNLDMTAAITFAGIPVSKFEMFAWIMNLKYMDSSTFYRIRKEYIAPVIRKTYANDHKETISSIINNGSVTLIGDGRCDSPGHSAKFGTYTMMDANTGKIVDTVVVAVTEVRVGTCSIRFLMVELKNPWNRGWKARE